MAEPFDGAIADFTYQDDWYVETDGDGASLVVRDEHDAPRHLQNKSGWRPSFQNGGTPGQAAPNVSPDFTQDGTIDIHDVNAICSRIRTRSQDLIFDLTGDNLLDAQDLNFMIESVFHTRVGDVNLDGRFDSRDLVAIFQAAQYDDGIPVNSKWSTGDWNCDGEFDSSDLVVAFQAGGYSAASRINRAAIAAAIVFSDDE